MSDSTLGRTDRAPGEALAWREETGWLLAAATLCLFGLGRRGVVRRLAIAAGVGLAARGVAPAVRRTILRAGTARRSIDIGSTLVVERSVSETFTFFSNFENFPRLVHALVGVLDHGDGRSRWIARAPEGEVLQWDAIVTKFVPNQVIAWESVPDSPVVSSGLVRFHPLGEARTRLDVRFVFVPRRTSAREAVRAFFHAPAARGFDEDLALAPDRIGEWDPFAEPPPPTPLMPSREDADG